jgi:hypothetical protein
LKKAKLANDAVEELSANVAQIMAASKIKPA